MPDQNYVQLTLCPINTMSEQNYVEQEISLCPISNVRNRDNPEKTGFEKNLKF